MTDATFCTLFNGGEGLLTKDVGLIPYGMHKFLGCDSFVAMYDNEFSSLKYVPGLRVEGIKRRFRFWLIDSAIWLMRNAKRIDMLNIYHIGGPSVLYTMIYRILNQNGKIYLKFDGAPDPKDFNVMKRALHKWMIRHCDFISTELPENAKLISESWHKTIAYIPNPLNPNEIHDYRPFSERSDIILFTGRIEREKGSHTLLEAFARIADRIPNWKLKLVRDVTEQNITDEFFAKYPRLNERVMLTGYIDNRDELTEIYRDSKIFAFSSRRESFGISLIEAMMNGCFIVCSRIPSLTNLTENFRFALGSDVNDVDSLAKNLLYACTHEFEIERLAIEGRNATLRRCDLKTVSEIIAEGMK